MALTKVTSGVRTLSTSEVATANIADDAVTSAKIADDSVGLAALAPQTDGSIISFDASTNPTLIAARFRLLQIRRLPHCTATAK